MSKEQLSLDLINLLGSISHKIEQHFDQVLGDLSYKQALLLKAVAESNGRVKDLVVKLKSTRQNIHKGLKKLLALGYLQVDNASGGYQVKITRKGLLSYRTIATKMADQAAFLLARETEHDLAIFRSLLVRLID